MKVTVFADLHLLGPQSLDIHPTTDVKSDGGAVYIGDNVDRAYCSPDDLPLADTMLRHFKKDFKNRYVSGNHELEEGHDYCILEDDDGARCLFTHGDYLLWSYSEAKRYRSRKPGANLLTRIYKGFIYNVLDKFLTYPITEKQKHKLAFYALGQKCGTIVVGHWHVCRVTEYQMHGVRIVLVPRGVTEIII